MDIGLLMCIAVIIFVLIMTACLVGIAIRVEKIDTVTYHKQEEDEEP